MKNTMTRVIGASVLLTCALLVSGLYGQMTKGIAQAWNQPRPSSSTFAVCDVVSFPVWSAPPALVINPDGREMNAGDSFIFQVDSLTSGGGSKGGSLNVYLQTSCDEGRTWNDVAVAAVPNAAIGTYQAYVSTVAAAPTTIAAVSDGTMTTGTDVQGPVGKRFRIRFTGAAVGTPGGTWTFQAFLQTQNASSKIARKRAAPNLPPYVQQTTLPSLRPTPNYKQTMPPALRQQPNYRPTIPPALRYPRNRSGADSCTRSL